MKKRRDRHQPRYLEPLCTHIHEKLYPSLTTERRAKIEEDLKRNRNSAIKRWRGLENIFLDMPTKEELERGFADYSLTAVNLEDDRRKLRIRFVIWACLLTLLIVFAWSVGTWLLGGLFLMVEFWKYGCQAVRKKGYPDWEPGSMTGWLFMLIILEGFYIGLAALIYNSF